MAKVKRHSPPKFLPTEVAKKWNGLYDDALKTAAINYPEDERAQHTAAHKAANVMLTVKEPKSADEIDALPDWQVVKRATGLFDGVEHKHVVTIDGRKYSHPIKAKKTAQAPSA